MKKFLFLLAILIVAVGLMANAVPRVAQRYNGPQDNTWTPMTRDIFYTENFETGATGWTHWDAAVTPNNWHIYANGDAQGDVWWMGDPSMAVAPDIGGYHDHQYLVLDTPASIVTSGNTSLTYKMRLNMEAPGVSGDFDGWDSFNIRISTNAGITYTVIPTTLITPGYDFASSFAFGSEHGETPPVPAWGGVHEPWVTVTVDLSAYVDMNVKIRFAFASDPAYNTEDDPTMYGVMVDDIAFGSYSNNGVDDAQMTWSSLVPTAGDFWHVATDANAPSPTHIMSSMNSANTYVNFMLDYLESPSILLPAAATQIIADFQLKGSYFDPGVFPDQDYFGWEISPDNGATWLYMSNVTEDPDGFNYVYSSAPANWASMINSYTLDGDITLFAGNTVKFRWYFQSNGTAPQGTPLQIDDFQIFSVTAAPAPVNLVYPLNNQANLPDAGFTLDWTASSLGALPEYYVVYMDQTLENLELATFAPSYNSAELTVSYCLTNDILTFNPLDLNKTWYWTVVASVTGQADAYSDIFRFDLSTEEIITTFPWNEDFEGARVFPPVGWTTADLDGTGSFWAESTLQNHTTGGTKSALHAYGPLSPESDGWLITPAVSIPFLGTWYLSWWNYNVYGDWMVYNGVKINTFTNDPNDTNWLQIWSQDNPPTSWSNEVVNISDYYGQVVYFAFNYQGGDADNWYVDDVSVYELTVDNVPPTITHLPPLLNTPREDINYLVYADIVDDAVWNNPIGGANLYYSTDGGVTYNPAIPMILDARDGYYAYIPGQPLATDVTYYIEGWDSELNYGQSDEFSFSVADPVWIWYDTGAGSPTWFGATTQFSPTVLFENPFYGTDTAVKLNAVDGIAYDNAEPYEGFNADLYVYGWDGTGGVENFDTILGPVSVFFGDGTYEVFDLTTYDVQIDYPYFFVRYNIPLGNAYYIDSTYDYGTTYVMIGGGLYTLTNPGSWLLGANVGTGELALYEAPVATIALNGSGNPEVTWAAVDGALSYDVYGSNDPEATWPSGWTVLADNTTGTSYTYTGTETMKFFKVVASPFVGGGRTVTLTPAANRALNAPVFNAKPELIKKDFEQVRK